MDEGTFIERRHTSGMAAIERIEQQMKVGWNFANEWRSRYEAAERWHDSICDCNAFEEHVREHK